MTEYVRPNSLRDALAVVNENTVAVAGATDIYPAQSSRGAWGQRSDKVWVDISALAELKGMTQSPTHWRIGALTTWSELIDARLPRCFDALVAAAHEVGGKQIQNRATIGGNLCNASPAADGIPPLLCLNAEIEMCSAKGARTLPLIKFIRGNRQTALADNELVTAILVPNLDETFVGYFYKLGSRKYLVISIVMVSIVVQTDERARITDIRVSVGSCSEVAQRLPRLETTLVGCPVDGDLSARVKASHLEQLSPISDIRADADYRLEAALEVIRRTLDSIQQAPERPNVGAGA